ncbi:nucleoside-diphosphate sugar epimerase/dehydratase [Deinococcus sonorensis]|uniref:Nucleoside-diphosphate sugar epimerase/dehydratase n=2 Tax=Deinococcus sonorensis TaxID=309891 RepID=A0AAU7UCP1_9DEIO
MPKPIIKHVVDLGAWGTASLFSYAFRTDIVGNNIPLQVWAYVLLTVIVAALVNSQYALDRQAWRQVGVRDLAILARAVVVTTLILFAAGFLLRSNLNLPRSIPVLTGVLAFIMLGGLRLSMRLWNERRLMQTVDGINQQRVLVVGAGSAGIMIVREMQRHPEAGLIPVGFLDDEPGKARQRMLGLPVLGRVDDLVAVVERTSAQEILIAVPSASGDFVRRVVTLAAEAKVRHRIIPGVFEILSGTVNINQIRDVNVEDLLRRQPVKLHTTEIADYLKDQVVLVTGAGGSIGSELVRQLIAYRPATLLLFGRGENSIFSIQQELNRNWPEIKHIGLIGDVRDEARLRAVFDTYRPQVVFHAAAHKHVPLMEQSPSEAILNNVVGTRNVVRLCLEYSVRRLVNVSTDKAVNPTSVMGASKRVAEMVVAAGAARAGENQAFVSVRFGNVLGSRGSVVPTFMNQIREGGPITVTHPEMVRYFMTIPEASRLVLQAGGLAENGKVYVLNMGQPVKISDLAHDVIRLSGAQNVDVVYSGIRPGEKLYEELLTSSEGTDSTSHSEIFSAKLQQVDPALLSAHLTTLQQYAAENNVEALRAELARLIPEHKFGAVR